ncbi:MAG: DUF3467 domain-containing protein [Gammaproteobacteria bacterium]
MAASDTPTESNVRWDDSHIRSSYANVCNIVSSREEVSLLFGMNQRWDAKQNELTIELSERIVLNPYAAKRVAMLLANVIEQYEQKFGAIDLDGAAATPPAAKPARGAKS